MDEEERDPRPEVADETDEKRKSESPAGEAADRNQMRRYVKMPARYAGTCKACKTIIRVGEPMVWDTDEKKAYCAECGMEHMMEQGVDEEDD